MTSLARPHTSPGSSLPRRRSSGQLEKDWVDFDALDTSLYRDETPLSEAVKSLKIKAVEEALAAGKPELVAEYSRATEGLVSTHLRAKVWPLLLEVDIPTNTYPDVTDRLFAVPDVDHLGTNDLPPHKDEGQVMLDIKRLFTVMSHFNSFHGSVNSSFTTILSLDEIDQLRKRLFCLVVRVLRKHPSLNYYQGYHDVASVVLLVFNDLGASNDELAFMLLEKLTVNHLRDFMISDIALSINHLKLIPCIVEEVDPTLFKLIRQSSNSAFMSNGAYFDYKFLQALLSILTLFSHDVSNSSHLLVMWDFIFSYNSVATSMYIYVAAMLHFRSSIFASLNVSQTSNFLSVDSDLVHTLLSPNNLLSSMTDSDLVKILSSARQLMEDYPPSNWARRAETIDVWFGEFNQHSVLCTTSKLDSLAVQSTTDVLSDDSSDPEQTEYDLASNSEKPQGGLNWQSVSTESELESLIMLQEEEQRKETIHETELFQRVLEQDSLVSSVVSLDGDDSSRMPLLSSSLSNLSAASSYINHKVMHSSSIFFKKLFSRSDSEEPESAVTKRNPHSSLQSKLYRVSFTIGFVGFLIHFLLKNSEGHHTGIFRIMHGDFSAYKSILSIFDWGFMRHEMANFGNELVSGASRVTSDAVSYLKDSEVVNVGLDFTQVGLGLLRNSVYAFGN